MGEYKSRTVVAKLPTVIADEGLMIRDTEIQEVDR